MTQHFDIVIVGAGPAGLAAATAASAAGKRIVVLDDNPRAGGQVWRQGPGLAPAPRLSKALHALREAGRVTFMSGARAIASQGGRQLLVETPSGGAWLSYEALILTSGARELLLPFPGWTLPGVTGAGGLQALIKGGVDVRGERIVIAGTGPLLIAALATAREAGASVVAVLEQAPAASLVRFGLALSATPGKLVQAAQLTRGFLGTRYKTGTVVRAVHGDGRVESVEAAGPDGRRLTFACDRVACGFGLVPNVTLAQALGCSLDSAGAVAVDTEQRTSVAAVFAAGECTGIGGMERAVAEGEIAGLVASGQPVPASLLRVRARWHRFAALVARTFALGEAARAWPAPDTLLCRCEDVPFGEVACHPAWREAKLHTRCGMGPCQGRVCGAAARVFFGWSGPAPRPPFIPARIDTLLAGVDRAAPSAEASVDASIQPSAEPAASRPIIEAP
jgi:NADPH-dependent 2,4-dienoyl-CoA reductase/sulfur reductase-like enzyme